MTIATQPYLADLATLETWAEGASDPDDATASAVAAQGWLERNPQAIAFGIDDDEIQAAFDDIYTAGEWLKDTMRAAVGWG